MSIKRSISVVYAGGDDILNQMDLPPATRTLPLDSLSKLPEDDETLLLVTPLVWLEAQTPEQHTQLLKVASMATDWLVVGHADADDSLLFKWLQRGATDVVSKARLRVRVQELFCSQATVWHDKTVWLLSGPMIEGGNEPRCGAGLGAKGFQVRLFTTVDDFPKSNLPALLLCSDLQGLMLAKVYLKRTCETVPVICLSEEDVSIRSSVLYVPCSTPDDQLVTLVCQQILTSSKCPLSRRYTHCEQILQALDEHAIVSVTDSKGLITFVNDRFCDISGYNREELIGQNHRMLKSGVHEAEFYQAMWSTLREGKSWQGVMCNLKKNGNIYWVDASIKPFFNSRSEIIGYCSIRTDITQLKIFAKELAEKSEMLRQSQIFANIGTWDWNIKTGDLFWSEQIALLFGYKSGELETSYENFLEAIHPDDRVKVENAVSMSLENRAHYEIEHRVVWPDGQVRWLLEKGSVVFGDDGEPTHMLGVVQDIQARKATELALAKSQNELAESNAMLRLVLDAIPARVFWKDVNLHYLGANQAFCRDAGKQTAEELIGLNDHDLPWEPTETDVCNAGDRWVLEQNQPRLNFEEKLTNAEGKIAWLRTSKIPIENTSGEVVGLLGVCEDITEAHYSQQALKENEARLSLAVEGAGDGIWDWNIPTGDMIFSSLYMSMLGYDEYELPHNQKTWIDSVHPSDWERVSKHLNEYLSGIHNSYSVQMRLRCKTGSYKWVLCRGQLVERDEKNRPLRMIGIHADIDEQKKLEFNLSMFRQIFDASEPCIVVANAKLNVVFANQSYINTTGYSDNQVVGHHIERSIAKEGEAKKLVDSILLQNKRSWSGLTKQQGRDGAEFVAASHLGLVKTPDGHFDYLYAIFSDFTEENLRIEELAKAKELAEKANNTKSDFLSRMSHELRTPMNAVIGFAQLLEFDEQMTNDQQDNVSDILKAGRHLLTLINEVLDLAKIESGSIDLSIENIDLDEIIKESYSLMVPLAEQRMLSFEIDVKSPLHVFADSVRLKQILLNLISNAIKYNDNYGRITITAETVDEAVRVCVIDTGIGINLNQKEELFQPFNRLDTKSKDTEGTGIGLTITRHLVEMMGGRIGVEKNGDKGTVFWFELPVAKVDEQDIDIKIEPSSEIVLDNIRQFTILCIDDNPANLKLIEHMLKRRSSITVITTIEPEIGIELAIARQPDLILLDINMPRIDGYEVLRILRSRSEMRGVPIIAVTANAMLKDINRGLAAGFADYLTKPLNLKLTIALIDKYIADANAEGHNDFS